jgi:peptidoglycan/LPS O-acetylase OafA/YrhL
VTTSAPVDPGAAGIESGPAAGHEHFPCLDAYRGIGMTMVMLIHVHASTNNVPHGFVGDVLRRFDLGLELFFVLSGFLIFRPFFVAQLAGKSLPPVRKYLRRRALRVFPGYWFALVMALVLFNVTVGTVGKGFVLFGLLQSFSGDHGVLFGGIDQSWSLMTELCFYAMLPLFAAVVARVGRGRPAGSQVRVALTGCAVLYAIAVAFRIGIILVSRAQSPGDTLAYRMTLWMPGHLDMFAIGMALAVLSAWVARGAPCPPVINVLSRRPNLAWLLGGVVFLAVCFTSPPSSIATFGPEYAVRLALYGVIAALVLVPSFFGDQRAGGLRHLLASPVMVYLGTVSLGFYLWHKHIIDRARVWFGLGAFQGTTGDFVDIAVITFVLALAAATVSYFVAERPFLRLKDRPLVSLLRRPARAGATS